MRKIKIIISEPWDFESPDGENIILGDILMVNEDYAIIKSHHSFVSHGINNNIIKLTPRNKVAKFNINERELSVNGGLFKGKWIDKIHKVDDDNFVFMFVGYIAEIY